MEIGTVTGSVWATRKPGSWEATPFWWYAPALEKRLRQILWEPERGDRVLLVRLYRPALLPGVPGGYGHCGHFGSNGGGPCPT